MRKGQAARPRVLLATLGSLGDLHPFIAVGRALVERGAEVLVACAAEYRDKVQQAGLQFAAVRPSFAEMQLELGMTRAQLTAAVLQRHDFLLTKVVMPHLEGAYADLRALVDDADLLLTSTLTFGARVAAEERGVEYLALVLQPLMFLSAYDPPVVPRLEWIASVLSRLGPAATRGMLQFFKRAAGRQLRPVQELRARVGLPAQADPLFEGQFSAAGAIGLYSPLLGAVRSDYPAGAEVAGFAWFDSVDGAAPILDPALRDFLAAGPPPLVFTLGSLIVHSPGAFYRASLAAARALRRRAVLLVGEDALAEYAGVAGPDVHVAGYAPHSVVFPRAAAIVHQGGIGTLAQALRSGRPHLIVPFYADQADNAARAMRLGSSRRIAPWRYHAASAARELRRLLSVPAYTNAAVRAAAAIAREDGAARAAEIVMKRIRLKGEKP